MSSKPRAGLPSFWSTHLAKVLVGDQPCNLSVWLSGHFDLDKLERDDSRMTQWKTDHTEQLHAFAEQMREDGYKIDKEKFFRVPGRYAIVSGKADLVTTKKDCRPTIWDIKSGKRRDSDTAQVLIEMILIPMFYGAPTMQFNGGVVYPGSEVSLTPADAEKFRPKLFAKIRELAQAQRPAASPSRDACRFCDVNGEDCTERFQEEAEVAVTEEF